MSDIWDTEGGALQPKTTQKELKSKFPMALTVPSMQYPSRQIQEYFLAYILQVNAYTWEQNKATNSVRAPFLIKIEFHHLIKI